MDFLTLKKRADDAWNQWVGDAKPRVNVTIDSSSIHHGARKTLEMVGESLKSLGIDAEVGTVGTIGTSWADPTVDIARAGGPRVLYGYVTPDIVHGLLEDVLVKGDNRVDLAFGVLGDAAVGEIPSLWQTPFFRHQERLLMADYGIVDPENILHYIANGGYEALHKAVTAMTPEEVIGVMNDSGLGGRGGAFFPTGRKWDFLRTAPGDEKYMLCNADEGDPGSYVNRVILESEPDQLIEGMAIACYATGARDAKIYLRSEYPFAAERLQRVIDNAYGSGLLGENIFGADFTCEVELVVGAGSYVCGEETGMIASMQDDRGMPRIKPPFPAEAGLFWKPSNVNNVESYANAPMILRNGGAWYAKWGPEGMKGTKMFSLSGDVLRPGVLEVEFGVPLSLVVNDIGGGDPDRKRIKAVQSGGPLSGYVPGDAIDTPIERNAFSALGTLVGSGGLVVMNADRCIVEMTRMLTRFCQDESCGRCTTCRIGTMRLVDMSDRAATGSGRISDYKLIAAMEEYLQDSNCVHGQFSATALASATRHFKEEWDAHIRDGYCEGRQCEGLIQYAINPDRLTDPDRLIAACPAGAIVHEGAGAQILQDKCVKCGACAEVATDGSVEVISPIRKELVFKAVPKGATKFDWVERGRVVEVASKG